MALSVKVPVLKSVPPLRVKMLADTEPGTPPKLLSALTLRTPPLIVVVPVYVLLVPLSVSVPLPVLVSPTDVALPFCKTPLKLVEVLSPPAVNVNVPAAELLTVPAPANEPTVRELPFKSNVVPLETVTAPVPNAVDDPAFVVTVFCSVVGPLYVLLPDKVVVPYHMKFMLLTFV